MKKYPIIDKDATIYQLSDSGEKDIELARYRKDIEDTFFIAKDTENDVYWVVSELFKELCINNGLLMRFSKPDLFDYGKAGGTDCNSSDDLVKRSEMKRGHVTMELKEKILEFAKLLMNE